MKKLFDFLMVIGLTTLAIQATGNKRTNGQSKNRGRWPFLPFLRPMVWKRT